MSHMFFRCGFNDSRRRLSACWASYNNYVYNYNVDTGRIKLIVDRVGKENCAVRRKSGRNNNTSSELGRAGGGLYQQENGH